MSHITTTAKPPFSEAEKDILTGITIFGAALSLLGASFIIIAYLTLPKLQTFAFKLVFLMAICDFINALGGCMGGSFTDGSEFGNPPGLCSFQGILIQFGSVGSILWVAVISHCIQEVVLKRNMNVEDHMNKYHCLVWGFSIFSTCLPLFTNSYGDASGWCWITNERDDVTGDIKGAGHWWRIVCFYIPLWIVIAWVCWIYYRTLKQLKDTMDNVLNRMKYYPVILIASYFFATINRVTQFFTEPVIVLTCLHIFFSGLSGFFNSNVYGWTPAVRAEIIRCCKKDDSMNPRLLGDFDFQDADERGEASNYMPPKVTSVVRMPGVDSLDRQVEKDRDAI